MCVVCIVTGLPASGKSTFLVEVQKKLLELDVSAYFFHIDTYLDIEMTSVECQVHLEEHNLCEKSSILSRTAMSGMSEQRSQQNLSFSSQAWQAASQRLYNDVFSFLFSLIEKTMNSETIDTNVKCKEHFNLSNSENTVYLSNRKSEQCVPFVFIEDNMHLISMREKYWRLCRRIAEHRSSSSRNDEDHQCNVNNLEKQQEQELTHCVDSDVYDSISEEVNDKEFVALPWIAMVELRFDTPLLECLRRNENRRERMEIRTSTRKQQTTIQLEKEAIESVDIDATNIKAETRERHICEPKISVDVAEKRNPCYGNNSECEEEQLHYIPPAIIKRLAALFEHGYEKVALQDSNDENVVLDKQREEENSRNGSNEGKLQGGWHIQESNRPWTLLTLNSNSSSNIACERTNEWRQNVHSECLEFITLTDSAIWQDLLSAQYAKIIKARLEIVRQWKQQSQKGKHEQCAAHTHNAESIQEKSNTAYNFLQVQQESELLLHNIDLRLRSVVSEFCKGLKDRSATGKEKFAKRANTEKKKVFARAKHLCTVMQFNDALQHSLDDLIEQFCVELQQIELQVE